MPKIHVNITECCFNPLSSSKVWIWVLQAWPNHGRPPQVRRSLEASTRDARGESSERGVYSTVLWLMVEENSRCLAFGHFSWTSHHVMNGHVTCCKTLGFHKSGFESINKWGNSHDFSVLNCQFQPFQPLPVEVYLSDMCFIGARVPQGPSLSVYCQDGIMLNRCSIYIYLYIYY